MIRSLLATSFLFISLLFCTSFDIPSKYVSRTGHLHVESSNRFKDIVADNYQVYCELNPINGKVSFTGLLKSFEFELGALDQAFNSGKVNLSEFAKFKFNGQVSNYNTVKFDAPGNYPVTVNGMLKMGGFDRQTSARGTLTVLANGKIKANAKFTIKIEQESVNTINKLMKEKLPSVFALDIDKLGVSRDIKLVLSATYRPRG